MGDGKQLSLDEMKRWIESNKTAYLEQFMELLSFPSISSEPQFVQSVMDCALWLSDYLEGMGFSVESWETKGYPVIFASNMQAGDGKPTLLIYHHYDVQPADPLENWLSPPFDPQLRDGQIYARGAQDNKGQLFYVLQALKLLLELKGALPINIKLCIEGEEEVGSPSLSSLVLEKKRSSKQTIWPLSI